MIDAPARRMIAALIALFVSALTTSTTHGVSDIVISQVYVGGNIGTPPYRNDFIELFNRGTTTVSLLGWSIQVANTTSTTWQRLNLSGTIPAGGYFLIQLPGGTVGAMLPTPDLSTSVMLFSMGTAGGKVALVGNTTTLTTACAASPPIIDVLGYNNTNCFEGAFAFGLFPTPLTNLNAAVRNSAGCDDTDVNHDDFTAAPPNPRNSASPLNPCSGGPPPTCMLTPDGSSSPAGGLHTVTVTVTAGAEPVADIQVAFEITRGPNAGLTGSGSTDAAGQAMFMYTSNGTPGTDTIQASGSVKGQDFQCTAMQTWEALAPPMCDLTPDGLFTAAGGSQMFTVTVTEAGAPAAGVDVLFTVVSGPDAGRSLMQTTDAAGQAAFLLVNSGGPGVDTIEATGSIDSVPFSCAASITWYSSVPITINEIDVDQGFTDTRQFIELHSAGPRASLDGLVLVLFNGNLPGDASYLAIDLDGHATSATGHFVIGNGGVVPTPAIIIPDADILSLPVAAVALYAGNAEDFPDGTLPTTINLLDAVVYDTDDADDTALLAALSPGQPQINEGGGGSVAAHSSQRCTDSAGGPGATAAFMQSAPTPWAANAYTNVPTDLTVEQPDQCTRASVLLAADSGPEETVRWTAGSLAAPFIPGGAVVTVNPTETTMYFARVENLISGCLSEAFESVEVVVTAAPEPPGDVQADPATLCTGGAPGAATLSCTVGPGQTADWFTGTCGGTLVGTGTSIVVSVSETTTFYVRARDEAGNCGSVCVELTVAVDARTAAMIDLAMAGAMADGPVSRCIRLEFAECPGEPAAATVDALASFVSGQATVVVGDLPCGAVSCVSAFDPLHTLRATLPLSLNGSQLSASFAGADALISGNLNGDSFIDILDFGGFVGQFGTMYPSADTLCGPRTGGGGAHADFDGDGSVGLSDFTFIQVNFLRASDGACCGKAGVGAATMKAAVSDLVGSGLGGLAVGDLNHDGWLDDQDVAAFASGARPQVSVGVGGGGESGSWFDPAAWAGGVPGPETDVVIEGEITIAGGLASARHVTISAGGALQLTGGSLSAQSVTLQGGAAIHVLDSGSVIDAAIIYISPQAVLSCVPAVIAAEVINAGLLHIASDGGSSLQIAGKFLQLGGGTLRVVYAGLSAAPAAPAVVIEGAAELAGELILEFDAQSAAATDDPFTVLGAQSIWGAFEMFAVEALPAMTPLQLMMTETAVLAAPGDALLPPGADLNGSGTVDGLDLGILLGAWSVPPSSPGCDGAAVGCPADLNDDGVVNGLDLGLLLGAWTG